MNDALRDKIARALSAQTICDGGPRPSELHFRQADAVLAVIDLDKVRAEAWDAAVASMRYEDGSRVEIVASINPYRKAEQ